MQVAARPCGAAVSSGATIAVRQPRRGRLVVQAVAASQPATRLTKDDLVSYLASGCKPRDQWRCAVQPPRGWQLAAAAAAPAASCQREGGRRRVLVAPWLLSSHKGLCHSGPVPCTRMLVVGLDRHATAAADESLAALAASAPLLPWLHAASAGRDSVTAVLSAVPQDWHRAREAGVQHCGHAAPELRADCGAADTHPGAVWLGPHHRGRQHHRPHAGGSRCHQMAAAHWAPSPLGAAAGRGLVRCRCHMRFELACSWP